MDYVTDETWQNDTRKRWKATETENTRKGKNLNSEFLERPLDVSSVTLKSFFRVFSGVISFVYIHLIIRRLKSFTFSFLTPKFPFLVFWQIWGMGRGFIFRQKNILSNELRECRDVCVQRPSFFYSRKSRQSRQRLRVIISQDSWDYNSCVFFGRCTQRPYPLTAQRSLLTTQKYVSYVLMSNLTTHNSLLTTHCQTHSHSAPLVPPN